MELEIANTGDAPFSFTAALHTYLKVREVESLRIEGLRGLDYTDTANGGTLKKETGVGVMVDDEIDRIYHQAPATILVREDDRAMGIHAENFPDVVVWNPWVDKCAKLADMPADGFRRMLCVEAAPVREPIEPPRRRLVGSPVPDREGQTKNKRGRNPLFILSKNGPQRPLFVYAQLAPRTGVGHVAAIHAHDGNPYGRTVVGFRPARRSGCPVQRSCRRLACSELMPGSRASSPLHPELRPL